MRYLDFNTAELLKEATGEVSPCPLISHPNSDPHCDLRGAAAAAAAEVLLQKMLLSRRIVRVYNLHSCSVPPFRSQELCTNPDSFQTNENKAHVPHLPQDGQCGALFPPITKTTIHSRQAASTPRHGRA